MSTSDAPMQIGRVALTVNNIGRVGAFYRDVIGLSPMSDSGEVATFGAGGQVLLELRSDKAARRSRPSEAGLFHTAFLLPNRDQLARWLRYVTEQKVPLTGASDHLVSEALYLNDPEGNGVEVYADRPRENWERDGEFMKISTTHLDLPELAQSAQGDWTGGPDGFVVGHVHLQVGEIPKAEAFLGDALGLELTARYPGGSFYGSGGYHHHLAANTWRSKGAGSRDFPCTGLADVEILADSQAAARLGSVGHENQIVDPWGSRFTITVKLG